jgi:AcrR family transcriptional regulator
MTRGARGPGRRERAQDKRRRLVDAAWRLVYRQGLARTTLSEVAAAADVPLGNVYYYFRTKDDLVEAVLEGHKRHLREVMAAWEARTPDPRARLRLYLGAQARSAAKLAEQGCQHARLAQDLNQDPALRHRAGEILGLYIAWAERQLRALGTPGEAHRRAVSLVARVEGAIALGSTLRRPDLLVDELEEIEAWLDGLTEHASSAA